jgi:crossover junction endodeoxyribonuclease RuvC
MQIISIDPGQKGGIASLADGRAQAFPMPGTVTQIVDLIRSLAQPGCTLAVERSQPMPKQGVTSVFTYGQHYGGFEAIAACLGLRYVSIRPAEWKKAMGLNSDKTCSIIEAERLFPSVELIPKGCRKPSDGIAEALLIGEYARRNRM